MIHADLKLTALVFAFYLFECVYFLKPEEIAYTGIFRGQLRKWEDSPSSYTLMGRHLCFVNPLFVATGIAVSRDGDPNSSAAHPDKRLKAALRLIKPSIRWLRILCTALAFVLFAVLPFVVYRQLLVPLWRPLLADLLVLHLATCTVFTLELRRWQTEPAVRLSQSLAVFFNPVAAIRCIDVLSRAVFEELDKRRTA